MRTYEVAEVFSKAVNTVITVVGYYMSGKQVRCNLMLTLK